MCWRSSTSVACPGRVRYDNLKPAVVRVLKGRDRIESERFIALRSHYGFDSFFCRPGIEGAHEKGGVEGEIGRFRRRHLVPVPKVASLAELNELIAAGDRLDDDRVITGRPVTVGAAFAAEAPRADGVAGRGVRPGAAAAGAGRQPGPGVGAAVLLLGARPATSGAAYRSGWPRARSRSSTGQAGRPPRTGGRPLRRGPGPGPLPRGPQDQARRRCPGRPRWPRRRPAARSPPLTRPTGTRPAGPAATPPAPAP